MEKLVLLSPSLCGHQNPFSSFALIGGLKREPSHRPQSAVPTAGGTNNTAAAAEDYTRWVTCRKTASQSRRGETPQEEEEEPARENSRRKNIYDLLALSECGLMGRGELHLLPQATEESPSPPFRQKWADSRKDRKPNKPLPSVEAENHLGPRCKSRNKFPAVRNSSPLFSPSPPLPHATARRYLFVALAFRCKQR